MINRIFLLYCLTACSEYQLNEKKNMDDEVEELIETTTDTATPLIDTGTEETGGNQIDESIPVAVCSVAPNPVTPPFTPATFDGSNSYDTSGNNIISYYWELVEQPEGSAALLPFNSGIYISDFYADLAGEYVGELTVTNELGLSDSCRVSLEAIPSQNLWVEMF